MVAPLLALGLVAAGCGGGAAAGDRAAPLRHRVATDTTPSIATTTTTAPLPLEEAVRRAYLQSWDDFATAVWTLDAGVLENTYAEDSLANHQRDVERRIGDRRRLRVQVTHDIDIVMTGPDRAAVTDKLVNSSIAVDADTGAVVAVANAESDYFQTTMQLLDGRWKVVLVF